MAKNDKDKATVTRISASDGKAKQKAKKTTAKTTDNKKVKKAASTRRVSVAAKMEASKRGETTATRNPLKAVLNYLQGAWHELKQVRWPTRGATWSLTGAVLAFSAFFVVFILLADAAFKYLFEFILK